MARPGTVAEEHDEGYFASVSDLMVGILFVFLLMLSVFALNYRTAEDETRALQERLIQAEARAREKEEEARAAERLALAAQARAEDAERRSFAAQAEAARLQALLDEQRATLLRALDLLERDLEARNRARDRMLGTLESRLVERGVRVQIDQRSGVLRLAERDLRFPTMSADLTPDARHTVRVLAEVFADVLPCFAQRAEGSGSCGDEDGPILEALLVEGHTDRRPITDRGRFRDNYQLSAERALTVYREMVGAQRGLQALRNPASEALLAVSGYGEERPVAPGGTEADLQLNRRIDFRFVLSAPTAPEVQALRERIRQSLGAPR